ncbi:UTP--glucose-1-phosphate uridylyltransferase [bacterium]|nr:UTP--glucose-1-phosphate uridylyltransferase [bacterium]
MEEIKKAIIPAAGLGTRFLPITKIIPKELLPLVDQPTIRYPVKEAALAEISNIIFVLSDGKKKIIEYFKRDKKLESILKERGQKALLEASVRASEEFKDISFSSVLQPLPKGDGDAILRAKRQIGKEAFAVLFADDVFESKIPAIAQLKNIFQTSQKPIIGLKRVAKEKISSYGVVSFEKIANRLYKIKEIVEKPKAEEAPSDLAACGRYVLTPDVFDFLAKAEPNQKGEIILAQALRDMLKKGRLIYGYEIDGQWLECGNKIEWLKSNLYFSLKHPEFGPAIQEWFKKIK